MRVVHRTALAVLLPVAVLVVFAAQTAMLRHEETRRLDDLGRLVELVRDAGALVHELQIERGLSSGFIGGGGRTLVDELRAQRQSTDARIAGLERGAAALAGVGSIAGTAADLAAARKELAAIAQTRASIDALALS